MSGVSFSSSASQRAKPEVLMSWAQFVAGSVKNPSEQFMLAMCNDKMMAAYFSYLRKFDGSPSSSACTSEVSRGSTKSRVSSSSQPRVGRAGSWVAKSPTVSYVGSNLKIPRVSSPPPDGFCYLKAFKLEVRSATRKKLGSEPNFFELLSEPADNFIRDGSVRVSVVGARKAHVSSVGDHDFLSVASHLVTKGRTSASADSLWCQLRGESRPEYSRYACSMLVGSGQENGLVRSRVVQSVESYDGVDKKASFVFQGSTDKRAVEFDLSVKCRVIFGGQSYSVPVYTCVSSLDQPGSIVEFTYTGGVVTGMVARPLRLDSHQVRLLSRIDAQHYSGDNSGEYDLH